MAFLNTVHAMSGQLPGVLCPPPAPAPMERRAGRYRAHLLLVADDAVTQALHRRPEQVWTPGDNLHYSGSSTQ